MVGGFSAVVDESSVSGATKASMLNPITSKLERHSGITKAHGEQSSLCSGPLAEHISVCSRDN